MLEESKENKKKHAMNKLIEEVESGNSKPCAYFSGLESHNAGKYDAEGGTFSQKNASRDLWM